MITFLTWKWTTPGNQRVFEAAHVNALYAMVARFYSAPFRFVCITDESDGLDWRIEAIPLPEPAKALLSLKSPLGERFPSCYARLWTFSRDATALGERIFQLDIDCVILGDLMPLCDRAEDFVGWTDDRFGWDKIAGGVFLLRTAALPEIWDDFDPEKSPILASDGGFQGSDQGWMSYRINYRPVTRRRHLTPPSILESGRVGAWRGQGLVKINWTPSKATTAPKGARIVFTNGVKPPWSPETHAVYPWIKQCWG